MNLGIFSLFEGDAHRADDAVLLALDLDWACSATHSPGFSVYYLPDSGEYSYPTAAPYDSAWDVWVGLRGGKEMGAEVAKIFSLDFGGGLVADMGAAVFFTGDFYRAAGAPHPDMLWEALTRLPLEF